MPSSRSPKRSVRETTPERKRTKRRVPTVVWSVIGVLLGIVLAAATGFYVIYADLMSRVEYHDPVDDALLSAPNLLFAQAMPKVILTGAEGGNAPHRPPMTLPYEDEPGATPGEEDPSDPTDPTDPSTPVTPNNPGTSPAIPNAPSTVPMKRMDNVENILLFGVDARGNSYRGRSDTIIIVAINHTKRTVTLVSLFRALEVNIPGYAEPTLLNAAYAYGGPRLAVQTVESNFGIPIKGFITFNFGSLEKLVDAIDGIQITLTEAEARELKTTPGPHYFMGWTALQYARIRKIDTDFHRNQRQRNVIDAILKRIASGGVSTLYNAATVVLANSVTNLNLNDYVLNAQTLFSYTRRQMQVPIWYGNGKEAYSTHNRHGQEVWPLYDKRWTSERIYQYIMN